MFQGYERIEKSGSKFSGIFLLVCYPSCVKGGETESNMIFEISWYKINHFEKVNVLGYFLKGCLFVCNRGATFAARQARIEGARPIPYTLVPSFPRRVQT